MSKTRMAGRCKPTAEPESQVSWFLSRVTIWQHAAMQVARICGTD